ncbi:cation diffusion facilitator family transporter [Turneriella parva]|uniref:Cation diffusion facilitator family transporter n=1 Tax=Turneriella parva (strain ATCC BAA-1111 / DSM 21527 / NCTC 11395 / H) TaxID=869212 RepID=I4BB50_TURPD|nr:cation diffusion facilitator family transporter [Turneriella parva]AFM14507.1 cation diffusion facilitator family transporter [Turneriella parva DSM 21527]
MASGTKAIYYALAANTGIAVTKTAAAIVTASTSMTAEAIHSFADCGNQILLLIGMKKAQAPASELHPLGYGKVSYFWSFMVALLLFSVGGVFSAYEGIHKLAAPQPLQYPWVAIAVLSVGVVLETMSLFGALKEIRPSRANRSLYRWFRETRQSELMVVIGEDIAALLGLVIALVFVLLAYLTQKPIFDAIGSIVIGFLLIFIAVLITLEIKSLIIGESADDDFKSAFRLFIATRYPQLEILNLITQHHGHDIVLALKVRFRKWPASAEKLVAEINAVEKAIRLEFAAVRFIFFEPDISTKEKQGAVRPRRRR